MAKAKRRITSADLAASRRLADLWKRKANVIGKTQEEVAGELGWSQSAISQYIRGTTPIGVEAALKLAAYFKVDVSEIRPDVADMIDRSRSDVPIDRILRDLDDEGAQGSLDFIQYRIDKAEEFLGTAKHRRYVDFIESIKADLKRRRENSKNP